MQSCFHVLVNKADPFMHISVNELALTFGFEVLFSRSSRYTDNLS